MRRALALGPGERALWAAIGLGIALWLLAAQLVSLAFVPARTGEAGSLDDSMTLLVFAARNAMTVAVALGGFVILRAMGRSGDRAALPYLMERAVAERYAILAAALRIAVGLGSFALFMLAYTTIKTAIPAMAPFTWDEAFRDWDRALFFGRDAWQVFAGLYDWPLAMRALDFLYDFWAGLLVGAWVLAFVLRGPVQRRYRYCLALLVTWFVGGNVLAILMSSAGPVYFGAVTGLPDPYAAQMAALQALGDLRALDYQQGLWTIHAGGGGGLGGISAMPSMHCATAALLVLWVWPLRAARFAAAAFFAIVLLGSFMLAWHYAVDGLIGALVAAAAWSLTGPLARRIARNGDAG